MTMRFVVVCEDGAEERRGERLCEEFAQYRVYEHAMLR
jgi:hypothetical protein